LLGPGAVEAPPGSFQADSMQIPRRFYRFYMYAPGGQIPGGQIPRSFTAAGAVEAPPGGEDAPAVLQHETWPALWSMMMIILQIMTRSFAA
jgi:hypothetical protein